MLKRKQDISSNIDSAKQGFTLIEVMLVFAITGLMLIGVLAGTYSSINHQRYNDAVRSFADFWQGEYATAVSPQSNGNGNSNELAIFGKVISISDSDNKIYTATLVGGSNIPITLAGGFVSELSAMMNVRRADGTEVPTGVVCGGPSTSGSVSSYEPLWQSAILKTGNDGKINSANRFTGTIIIARSPTSGTIHTIVSDQVFGDLGGNCSAYSQALRNALKNGELGTEEVKMCVAMDGIGPQNQISLAADGRNASAVVTLGDSESGNDCRK